MKAFDENSRVRKLFDPNHVESDDSQDGGAFVGRSTNDQSRSKNVPDFLNYVPPIEAKKKPVVRFTDISQQLPDIQAPVKKKSKKKKVKKRKKSQRKEPARSSIMNDTPGRVLVEAPLNDKEFGSTISNKDKDKDKEDPDEEEIGAGFFGFD